MVWKMYLLSKPFKNGSKFGLIPSLKLTASSPLKIECLGDKPFLLGYGPFSGAFDVSFRDGIENTRDTFPETNHN